MSNNDGELVTLEQAYQNYNRGNELLQTSCIKCRCSPDYTGAIPFFKKAADIFRGCGKFEHEIQSREKLIKCFRFENSFWEEGNEYEKICKVQLNQLKSTAEAYNSIINAYNAYSSNHTYEDGIKALTKSSSEFLDNGNKNEAEKILEFAYQEIDRYYHVLTLNEEESHLYIYECVEKYIDLLFNHEKFDKASFTAQKFAELIEKENKEEKRYISKYYGFQSIAELLLKNEKKFETAIQKGLQNAESDDDFCSKINRLVSVVNQNERENEKLIKNLYSELSKRCPTSIGKNLYNKYIQINVIITIHENEINTNGDEDDMK